jgi:hypothetical protein
VRNRIVVTVAAFVALLIIYFFGGPIWSWPAWIVRTFGNLLVAITVGPFNILLAAVHLALIPLSYVVAAVLVAAIAVLGLGAVVMLIIALARHIGEKLAALGQQIRELHVAFRLESKRTARDAAFLALIGALSAVIAYMGTEEFLRHISTIRLFAVCSMGLVAAKLFFFFPTRVAKGCGMLLTFLIIVGSTAFVAVRYEFTHGVAKGFANLVNAFSEPQNEPKILLIAIIAILSLLALLFPFTISEWRRLLATPEQLSHPDTTSHADARMAGA